MDPRIKSFLDGSPFAVVGASRDRSKYGNIVLRKYIDAGRTAHPVNPAGGEIEGLTAYPDLASIPDKVHAISVITPPSVTERIVKDVAALGIGHVWMQPGAESHEAIEYCNANGINVIGGDACVLVILGYLEAGGDTE